jgi:hypothetical protein
MSATERLDQWAALADAATPAEMWERKDEYGYDGGDTVRIRYSKHVLACAYAGTEANAEFIAASREAVPALIAALRAVLALVDGVQPTRLIGGGEWPLLDARDVRDAIAFALEKGEKHG